MAFGILIVRYSIVVFVKASLFRTFIIVVEILIVFESVANKMRKRNGNPFVGIHRVEPIEPGAIQLKTDRRGYGSTFSSLVVITGIKLAQRWTRHSTITRYGPARNTDLASGTKTGPIAPEESNVYPCKFQTRVVIH
jgi:hypothetical protein